MLKTQQTREGDPILTELFDPDYQEEVGLLLHLEAERMYVTLSYLWWLLGAALINLSSK